MGSNGGSGHHLDHYHYGSPLLSETQHHDAMISPSMTFTDSRSFFPQVRARTSTASRRVKSHQSLPQRSSGFITKAALLAVLAAPSVMAQEVCVPLTGSTLCPAFQHASISTSDANLTATYPFLQYVSSAETFDQQLGGYLNTTYIQNKFQYSFGCGNISLTNTTDLYARFTRTVTCNSIVQNSKPLCSVSDADAPPVCADTCAQHAESEELIVGNSALCSNPGGDTQSLIRADFITCSLPDSALELVTCIDGATNEPDNCGFGNSTLGLCEYCGVTGQNNTDTCCYNSGAEQLCAGLVLPKITAFQTSFSAPAPTSTSAPNSSSPSASANATAAAASSSSGLSKGAIAGIVIGAIVGLVLLAGLIFAVCLCLKRRRGSQHGSILNQPTPARSGAKSGMAYKNDAATTMTPEGYEVLPGGRIARMSALEGYSGGSRAGSEVASSSGAAAGAYVGGRRRHHDQSSSEDYGESPTSALHGNILRPPTTGRRQGSLSSSSALGLEDPQTPHSGSAERGITSQQSEQLNSFKDYYSHDEIHPGDKVATLWAYQPRAGDEFALERGDMLKVIGIWDDGWATGVLLRDRAEDWDDKKGNPQRDSGVSSTSSRRHESPPATGDIKAFPIVCVCLPEHWRRTIEGDGSTETGSSHPTQPGS